MPKMRAYCSMSQNFITFNTPRDAVFLVFGVPNAKYLAFDTLNENALNETIFEEYKKLCSNTRNNGN